MNYRFLLQNIVSFIGLFCKRDLSRDSYVILFVFESLFLTQLRDIKEYGPYVYGYILFGVRDRDSDVIWGGYGRKDRLHYRSLLQNIVSFTGLFAKET